MGAILDLPSQEWFGEFSEDLTVHVIDSSRPQNLSSLFGGGDVGERIVIWDDGGAERLQEERKAWEVLTVGVRPSNCIIFLTSLLSSNLSPTLTKIQIWRKTSSTRRKRKMSMKKAARLGRGDR